MHKTLLSHDLPSILAQTAPGGPGGMSPGMVQVLFFGLFIAAMWFLMIAPQRKKQKEHEKMLASLEAGDEIVTSGGIYGTVSSVREDRLVVRIADSTKIELAKGFVQSVVSKGSSDKKSS